MDTSHKKVVEHVDLKDKNTTDSHRGVGITGSLTVCDVKLAIGAETTFAVAKDVEPNV